jgi:type II secretory ATPase GspE/PulE/Tfp pilus assembly ATPase PilB-like protein
MAELAAVPESAAATGAQRLAQAQMEQLFARQLQRVTTLINETQNIDQLMLDISLDVCKLFNADRMTLYAVSPEGTAIVSKVKTGLTGTKELKLPIGPQSVAGFVADKRKLLNIEDVYDEGALRKIHEQLHFLQEVDKRSGYRTKQMLVAPIIDRGDDQLYGVLQLINNRADRPFGAFEEEGVRTLANTLGAAIRARMGKPALEVLAGGKYDELVNSDAITRTKLVEALDKARKELRGIEPVLLEDFGVTAAQLGAALARYFRVNFQPYIENHIWPTDFTKKLKREFVMEQGWIPFMFDGKTLRVVATDPEAARGSRMVGQIFPEANRIEYCVCLEYDFVRFVDAAFGGPVDTTNISDLLSDLNATDGAELDDEGGQGDAVSAAADNELVKFVNKVIVDAYNMRCSDIHIEPYPGKAKTEIRFRIDGTLQPYIEVPAQFRSALTTRLKIMCDLDISEKRRPQDGKIKFKRFGPLDIELRVATIPSAGGVEDVVMRILAAGEPIPLDKLGLTRHNKERLVRTIEKPYGLFYVCGPTGSGKTTTLHSVLKHLNTPETKIWTAEDPVEITQKGLRQVQVNRKAGLDFATVMRAFLRADPDIIMVGESRDKETVAMGVEASLTGHLVFSTLHTNSAPESITRLLDMGMDPFNFADALLGILAQRLAKRLCSDCKEEYVPDGKELKAFIKEYAEELINTPQWAADPGGAEQELYDSWVELYGKDGELHFYRARGCDKCNNTGYRGRVGLHELLIADELVKKLIQERARVAQIFTAAVASGMRTLKMDGMEKVMMGLTDLKQVRMVCIK